MANENVNGMVHVQRKVIKEVQVFSKTFIYLKSIGEDPKHNNIALSNRKKIRKSSITTTNVFLVSGEVLTINCEFLNGPTRLQRLFVIADSNFNYLTFSGEKKESVRLNKKTTIPIGISV